jgi:predicted phage tail protein
MFRLTPSDFGDYGGIPDKTPPSSPDLVSREIAQVAYLLSEGPIVGLVNGFKSIYLNDVPVQNPDGTFNFKGVSFAGVRGTNTQAVVPGFTDVEAETSVGAEIRNDTPQFISVTDPAANAVRLKIGFNALQRVNPDGSAISASVQLKVSISTDGGAYVVVDLPNVGTLVGQTASPASASWRIDLPTGSTWSIKIERLTADHTDLFTQDKSYLTSWTKIYDLRLRYPNSAVFCLAFDAKSFGSIPKVSFDVQLLQVEVPANYDPATRVYATTGTGTSGGTWDGTFKTAWTDNPAWCLYAMAKNARFGSGAYISAADLDKWQLYDFGQYCDQLVDDGRGSTEPRFRCNLYLAGREDAIKVLANMASIFTAQAYWSEGTAKWVLDRDEAPVALFSPSNITDGRFNYQGTARQARHTAALVTWNDPNLNYQAVPAYVADDDGIARYGLNTVRSVAMGCTSEGQAVRFGRFTLTSEKLQTQTVTFQTGLEGLAVLPGNIILLQDPSRVTARHGGRVVSATTTSVQLDAPIALASGVAYTLYLTLPDGTVTSKAVTTPAGTVDLLSWASALATAPQAGAQWSIWASADILSRWRVIGIRAIDKQVCEITALYHDPTKYALIETGFTLGDAGSSSTRQFLPPTALTLAEGVWVQPTGPVNTLFANWDSPAVSEQPVRYEAACSLDYAAWQAMDVSGNEARFSPVQPGSYRVRVFAIYGASPLVQHRSPEASATFSLLGKTTPPSDVTGFRMSRSAGKLLATWDAISDVDLEAYELRTGPSWETGVVLGRTLSTSLMLDRYQGGNYWLKAFDTSGNESAIAALVIISADAVANVVVFQDDAASSWPGTKTNFAADAFGLTMVSGSLPAIYETAIVDLGTVIASRVEFTPDIRQSPSGVTWSSWTSPWASYTDPWQGPTGTISAVYEVRSSDDGVAWTAWSVYAPGTYTARYYQFRVTCTTTDPSILARIYSLPETLDVPDRIVKIPGLSVGTGGLAYAFTTAYVSLQTVQVTVLNGAAGDTVKVTGKTSAGFTVNLYDSTGAPKAGTVDVTCFGYGEVS